MFLKCRWRLAILWCSQDDWFNPTLFNETKPPPPTPKQPLHIFAPGDFLVTASGLKRTQLYPMMPWTCYYLNYLVVSTHQKKISQIRPFPQVGLKTKNTWNHTPQWRLLNPLLHVACPLLRSATWKGVCAQLLQKCFSVTGESTVSFFLPFSAFQHWQKKWQKFGALVEAPQVESADQDGSQN